MGKNEKKGRGGERKGGGGNEKSIGDGGLIGK